MIKELWILARMLFQSKPSGSRTAKVIDMKHFPFKGYKAMAWCGSIIHRIGTSEVDKTTINHETIHLTQAKMCGSWVKYYWNYLREWVKGGIIMAPVSAAYYTISYEMEAYANEKDFSYPLKMEANKEAYTNGMLDKYVIRKGRKKLYKEVGGTLNEWKLYIRSL